MEQGPIRVLAIGTFDGVHRGHQALLARAAAHAARLGGQFAVMTFDPPPRVVLKPDAPVDELTPREEKVWWLAHFGAARVEVVPFTAEFAAMAPEAFLEDVVWEQFRPAVMVEGYDFTFGKGAAGNVGVLADWAAPRGVTVDVVEPVEFEGRTVSSSLLRDLVKAGQLDAAARYLGHPYTARGTVVTGDGRGRELGFPTANVALESRKLMPPYGVYAGMAGVEDGARLPAVANWGIRPMYETATPLLEVHVLDFAGDLYDAVLGFEFAVFLRPEARFEGVDALGHAIAEDARRTRGIFAGTFRAGRG